MCLLICRRPKKNAPSVIINQTQALFSLSTIHHNASDKPNTKKYSTQYVHSLYETHHPRSQMSAQSRWQRHKNNSSPRICASPFNQKMNSEHTHKKRRAIFVATQKRSVLAVTKCSEFVCVCARATPHIRLICRATAGTAMNARSLALRQISRAVLILWTTRECPRAPPSALMVNVFVKCSETKTRFG